MTRAAQSITIERNPNGPEMLFSLNSGSLNVPLAELAQLASRSGFQGLELWDRDINQHNPGASVRAVLERNNLQVSAFQVLRDFEGAEDALIAQRLEEAERMMSDMLIIGADTLLVCANTAPTSSGDRARIVADLRTLGDLAAARGLRIAFEPLAWSRWLNTYEEVTACIVAADHAAVGLAVDAFHWFWGRTPVEFLTRLPMDKCFEVQLSDARPDGLAAIDAARHHRLFPGEGEWPVAEFARTLRRLGFEGFYNIEVFNDAYKALPAEEFIGRAVTSINSLF